MTDGIPHKGLVTKRWPWDVDVDTTRPALERLARALILTSSTLTCSMTLGRFPLGRGISAMLRVHVPDGLHDRFREVCRPIGMRPPPQIVVGLERPRDDGHPGRKRDAAPEPQSTQDKD